MSKKGKLGLLEMNSDEFRKFKKSCRAFSVWLGKTYGPNAGKDEQFLKKCRE